MPGLVGIVRRKVLIQVSLTVSQIKPVLTLWHRRHSADLHKQRPSQQVM